MPSFVIDLKNAPDQRDVVHQAVEALSAGRIVALPTETVYGIAASALNSEAVQRLSSLKGRPPEKPFAFAIKSLEDALDYVPDMPPLARRLARRCWPGPMTLVLRHDHPDSVVHRLPAEVLQTTIPSGTIGLRVPAHETTLQVLRLLAGPIVLTSANLTDQTDCVDGAQVIEQLGEEIDLILDDGRSRFGQPSSVVQVTADNKIEMLRTGVIDETTLNQLSGFIAIIVCTGNTCRSPMGEAMLRKHIAEKIGCPIDELDQHGISIMSAGISAMSGGRAAAQAIEVMGQLGLDISGHSSQPVTDRLIKFADVVFAMTASHRDAILAHWPEAAPRTHLICRDGSDVYDPIGMSVDVYRSTAEQISDNLKQWVNEHDVSSFGKQDQ